MQIVANDAISINIRQAVLVNLKHQISKRYFIKGKPNTLPK